MIIPTAHQAIKQAGMTEMGTAAAIGALLSGVAARIPMIAELRFSNPMLYDAALAAGTVQVMETLGGETDVGHDQSMVPRMPAV
jgi:hypothetical protein